MSSKIKVDTIENVAGSGNVSLGSGHNLVVPGTLSITGASTLTGGITGDLTVDTNVLKVDSTNNRAGIGTTSPTHPLHIVTSTDGTGVSGDDKFVALFQNAEATDGRSYGVKIMAGSTTDQALTITDHDGSNDLLALQGNGIMTLPKQVSFRCGRTGTFTSDGNIVTNWNTVFHNVGSHFNTSTGVFTAPIAGVYQVGLHYLTESNTNPTDAHVRVNGSQNNGFRLRSGTSAGHQSTSASHPILLAANDTLHVFLEQGEVYGDGSTSWSTFSAYLLG